MVMELNGCEPHCLCNTTSYWSSLTRKLSILNDVAKGLSYLHTNQVIHLDLSPNNVFIKYSGVDQVPTVAKIADLGVAKMESS